MNNTINQLFSFDAGISNWEEVFKNNQAVLPVSKNSIKLDEDNNFLSSAISSATVKSFENEVEEIFLSLIKDMDRLRRYSFGTLLDETRLAIEMELMEVQDPQTQQALSDLIDLLKENVGLASLFQSYTNWLQKA